jgi:DNA-binding NarL/FixJ family response regulator
MPSNIALTIPQKKSTHPVQSLLKVAIIEDDEKLRELYTDILRESKGLQSVGAFGSVEEALQVLDDILPDVLIMDIGLPGMSGIDGLKIIKSSYPSMDILMLSVFEDEEKVFQSICGGASGYVLKNIKPEELVKAIKGIRTGAPMSPTIARQVLGIVRGEASIKSNEFKLTHRETDILQRLVEGMSFKQIGMKLFISPLTVHSHIKRIYEKLHVHSKSEAVAKVMKSRLF